jgi:hypothetical protein
MQHPHRLIPLALALIAAPAIAAKLHNKDGKAHDISIKCSSTSTASIQPNTIRDLGSGSCTVTIKSTGSSATASGGTTLVIKDGKLSAK